MKLELNAKTVGALALAKGRDEDFAWDAELEGFGLRLRRRNDGSIVRSWAVQYRIHGRTRRISLGPLAKLTPTEARKAAIKIFGRVANDGDPQAERQAKRRETRQTFRAVVADHLADRERKLRPASFAMAKLYLTGPYFRLLHGMGIGAITRGDVASCIRAVERKHSTATAATARRHLSTFFVWTIKEGLLGSGANPVDGTHRPADPAPRERVLTDAELVAVWNACDGDDDHSRIVRLLILTGSRRGEIGGMCWGEIEGGKWTLPAERSKNKREHVIVLPRAAFDIVTSVPRRAGREQLFGDRAAAGFKNWYGCKQALDAGLGDSVKPWRVHDLRRTVATGMADIGIQPHIIEAALNHFSGHRRGVAGVYNRSTYASEVKSAFTRWSEHVIALVEGRDSKGVTLRMTG